MKFHSVILYGYKTAHRTHGIEKRSVPISGNDNTPHALSPCSNAQIS